MPQLSPDAPDLAVSPDGGWVAELSGSNLRLYELRRDLGRGAPRGPVPSPESPPRVSALAELERPDHPGRIVFFSEDRLLHLWQVPAPAARSGEREGEGEGEDAGHIAAELLAIPTLNEAGRGLRVPGCTRILGVGPSGAVVAPSGPGADIVALRGNELAVHRTFIRGEVISAIAAPERRFLMEQRTGFELWDPQSRQGLGRLVLNTRQPAAHVGFALAGRVLWAVTGTVPMHLEVFRASDGRRLFELDQPGRALQADAAGGRLVVVIEERGKLALLDLDLSARALRRVPLPAGGPRPRSFVINPAAGASEALVLVDAEDAPLLRLPLPRLAVRAAPASASADRNAPSRLKSSRSGEPAAASERSTRSLRQSRPETRLIRRAAEPAYDADGEEPAPPSVRQSSRSAISQPQDEGAEPDGELLIDAESPAAAGDGVELTPTAEASSGPAGEAEAAATRQREMLGRVFDASRSPAAWQWELARWAQAVLLGTSGAVLPLPPEGGPLAALTQRLRLGPVAHKALGFLYAAQSLLGARPQGLRPIEMAQCLGPLHDEPTVLAELLPLAPLRTLELLRAGSDGHLELRAEAAHFLAGVPCPDLIPAAGIGIGRDPLPPGLYLRPGVCPARPQLPSGQPLIRVDALRERRPAAALVRALRRALLYDAVVLVDGLAGLSFPAFSGDLGLGSLHRRLASPRVPVVLCAMPDAPAALGLVTRALPMVISGSSVGEPPAPLLPTAPLPAGTTWRAPTPPASAAVVAGPVGRLEPLIAGDRRAAVLVGASATPEACASAAYLAARDGAALVLDDELTSARALMLATLLRQLPVCVVATPPAGPGTPWPAALQPFAASGSARP